MWDVSQPDVFWVQLVNTPSRPLGAGAALQNLAGVAALAASGVSLRSLFSWFGLFHSVAGA